MDRAHLVEETFLAPVGCAVLSADTQVIEREGWYQVITPSTRSTQGNEVTYSRIAAADADAVITSTIAQYTAHGVPFKWCIGPLTEPADMGSRLADRGLSSRAVRGMAIDPAAWVAAPSASITVEPVTAATLYEYQSCFARGWETPIPDPAAWTADHLRAMATGRFHFFLAFVDDRPAGTAGYITKPHCAYLVGGNVLPPFRGRGVYRALLDTRLREICALGLPLAVTQAREGTSAPILDALGFQTVYRSHIYTWGA